MNDKLEALFVSPHFDDVVLSCGGTASLLASIGRVVITTVFAAEPQAELNRFAKFQHQRWGIGGPVVDLRRREDIAAMNTLGVDYQWLDFPDAIYRGDLYLSDDELFGPVNAADRTLALAVHDALSDLIQTSEAARVYLPLAVGGHVDHRICREVAVSLVETGRQIWLYEDLPYTLTDGAVEVALGDATDRLSPDLVDVTSTFEQRLAAIACYESQLPTIFRHYGEPDRLLRAYASRLSGQPDRFVERFWKPYSPFLAFS